MKEQCKNSYKSVCSVCVCFSSFRIWFSFLSFHFLKSWKLMPLTIITTHVLHSCFFFNFSRIRRVNGLAWTDELTKVTWINIDQLVSSLILSLFLGHLHHILHDVEGPGDTVCFLLITNVNHSWLLPLQSRFFTFCYFSPPLSSPT